MQKKRKHLRKPILVCIIVAELMLAAAASVAIFYISWDHISYRRSVSMLSMIDAFSSEHVTADTAGAVVKARESVSEKRDEIVWTTKEVKYRKGPDKSYKSAGTLDTFTGLKRTGVTYNKWSRVVVDDKSYYIKSKYLTTDVPYITDGGAKGEYQKFALSQLANYGWDATEIVPLISLWNRESGWNPSSHNKSSGAHGIPQALPASKMAAYGSDYYTNGNTQILWGLNYIATRYGSPSNAWAHFCSSGWY